jgi:hypothetical protein
MGVGGILLDFLPEISNMNIHHAVDHDGLVLWIKMGQKFIPAEDPSRGCHECLKELELVRGEEDRTPGQDHFMLFKVQDEASTG